jgi:CPA2 family monovalent cation:H+ antiporter-2
VVNPLLFRAIPRVEKMLHRWPALWQRLEHGGPTPEPVEHGMADHVVVVGYGRVGAHVVSVLKRLEVSLLVIEQDAARAAEFQKQGIHTLFGDASNSDILTHAGLPRARALVVTVPDEWAAELIVTAARDMAPSLPIIARAATDQGLHRLAEHGARDVIHPELEGGLEVVRHTLLALDFPLVQVQQYVDAVRRDTYDTAITTHEEHILLDQLLATVRGMEIAWRAVAPESQLLGRTLAEANLRTETGASIIAIVRGHQVLANPKSNTTFGVGDLVGLIGDAEQVTAAARLIDPARDAYRPPAARPGQAPMLASEAANLP